MYGALSVSSLSLSVSELSALSVLCEPRWKDGKVYLSAVMCAFVLRLWIAASLASAGHTSVRGSQLNASVQYKIVRNSPESSQSVASQTVLSADHNT